MLTRAALEAEVFMLVGRLMALVGLAGRESDGYVRHLNAPLRDGLREMGYPVSDPLRLQDADLAGLDNFAVKRLIEWAELYVLTQVVRDWWRLLQAPPQGLTPEALALIESRMKGRIEELKAIVKRPFTPFVLPLAVGSSAAGPRAEAGVATWAPGSRPWGRWYYGVEPSAYWCWGDD